MDKKSEEYLRQYIKLTDTIKQKIEAHAARYHIKAEICAWYSDWEDFCSDWCDICGYSRTEARKLYHGGIGEFMKLPEGNGIVRFGWCHYCDLVYQSDDSSFDMLSGHGIDSILNVTDTVMDLCRDY